MTSIEEQWAHGTPERAVADAFSALRHRDAARLAAKATPTSILALAARVGPELDARDPRTPASSIGELADSEAASFLGRLIARLPELFTDSVRCLIVGHVLESRLVDASPDGRGLICLDCRVTGGGDEWLSVHGDRRMHREIANRAAGVAHVVFRVATVRSRARIGERQTTCARGHGGSDETARGPEREPRQCCRAVSAALHWSRGRPRAARRVLGACAARRVAHRFPAGSENAHSIWFGAAALTSRLGRPSAASSKSVSGSLEKTPDLHGGGV